MLISPRKLVIHGSMQMKTCQPTYLKQKIQLDNNEKQSLLFNQIKVLTTKFQKNPKLEAENDKKDPGTET